MELLSSGQLALTLSDDPSNIARFIYRAAAEVTWEPERRRLVSPRPELGPPATHFVHVARAAAHELGYQFAVTSKTEWVRVSDADRAAIMAIVDATGT